MGKRKREVTEKLTESPAGKAARPISTGITAKDQVVNTPGTTIQIVTGSYERALHGIVANIPAAAISSDQASPDPVTFADSFLFQAHTSSIRCLAVSTPSDSQKVFLASGGNDERINVYSLTTVPPPKPRVPQSSGTKPAETSALDSLAKPTAVSASNKDVGTLNHHQANVTTLRFLQRTKLLSAAADNSFAILRTRDWEVLTTDRMPIPKALGRPSGDTAGPGEVPAGINDVAIHPSSKLMLTVGRGDKCMRLWDMVRGKKAGVLDFDKRLLAQLGEGRYSSGEGRKALWNGPGDEFVILFERGACVFGIDQKPKAIIRPQPSTKLHQIQYLDGDHDHVLVVSTEDGRLLLYDTLKVTEASKEAEHSKAGSSISACTAVAQVGGKESGVPGRIKDFTVLQQPSTAPSNSSGVVQANGFVAITACSEGTVQLWTLQVPSADSVAPPLSNGVANGHAESSPTQQKSFPSIGKLIGTYQTGSRITCMIAFNMDGKPDVNSADADAVDGAEEADNSSSEDSDDSE